MQEKNECPNSLALVMSEAARTNMLVEWSVSQKEPSVKGRQYLASVVSSDFFKKASELPFFLVGSGCI